MPPSPRALTLGPSHHFFGYYEKPPWDETSRYLLAHEVGIHGVAPGPDDAATLGVIDTHEGNAWRPFDRTTAWHWQLGSEIQWRPGTAGEAIWNVRRGDSFGAVVRDVLGGTGVTRELLRPIFAVAPDGRAALGVNFARLADMRPGYGYVGSTDPGSDDPAPAGDGVFLMDLADGGSRLVMSLADLAAMAPDPSMAGAKHWVNHVQINADGSRFACLHRWSAPADEGSWRTRLVTAALDGSAPYILLDDGFVSHYDWRDEERLLAWARVEGVGDRYWLCRDRSDEREAIGEGAFTCDGHCSWSPDRRWILTDTYPDPNDGKRTLVLYRPADGTHVELGRFHSGGLVGPVRCDLHPRWSRDGRAACFDSVHEGTRQMYVIDVGEVVDGS